MSTVGPTTSLSPPITYISCSSWKPSYVACAERGDSERKHGVRGGGGDPCGTLQTFLHLAKSAHDLDRRGTRVNCGLSTCMTTHSRCYWCKDRSVLRDPVTANRYSCLARALYDCYDVAQRLRYPQQPCQTTMDSTPCNTRC